MLIGITGQHFKTFGFEDRKICDFIRLFLKKFSKFSIFKRIVIYKNKK